MSAIVECNYCGTYHTLNFLQGYTQSVNGDPVPTKQNRNEFLCLVFIIGFIIGLHMNVVAKNWFCVLNDVRAIVQYTPFGMNQNIYFTLTHFS